jgi:hypothetical protein
MALLPLIPSMAVAALAAWLLTRGRGLEAWPGIAAILQLVLHILWSGILVSLAGLSDELALPLASGLGVLTIAGISALLRLGRPVRRRVDVHALLEPEAEKTPQQDTMTIPKGRGNVPEAWVVQPWAGSGEPRPKRKRYFFTRRWR